MNNEINLNLETLILDLVNNELNYLTSAFKKNAKIQNRLNRLLKENKNDDSIEKIQNSLSNLEKSQLPILNRIREIDSSFGTLLEGAICLESNEKDNTLKFDENTLKEIVEASGRVITYTLFSKIEEVNSKKKIENLYNKPFNVYLNDVEALIKEVKLQLDIFHASDLCCSFSEFKESLKNNRR